jgi:hypothetical protein
MRPLPAGSEVRRADAGESELVRLFIGREAAASAG